MDKTIELRPLIHRGQEWIGLYFENNGSLNGLLSKYTGARWSRTNKCWYIPLGRESYNRFVSALQGKAAIKTEELRVWLQEKKRKGVQSQPESERALAPVNQQQRSWQHGLPAQRLPKTKPAVPAVSWRICPENAHVLPAMKQRLRLKAYSESTIKTYLNEMMQFLQVLKAIPADRLEPEHLRRYLVYCSEKIKLSENTLHSRINALKFYYEQVLRREKFFWEIPRPKKQIQLPAFFNQHEVAAIIRAAGPIKHKTMLMLGYAAGLRVSEIATIRVADIDSKRMCIIIRQAKGKKDRLVALSPVLLVMLREYWKSGMLTREGFLFPGQFRGEPYSSRSIQMVLAAAKKKAGIMKPGSVHALRHSFATHLLDKGTDVTMIQKLLGHNDIRTTLRYLHVTNRDMLQVMSPLDDLKLD